MDGATVFCDAARRRGGGLFWCITAGLRHLLPGGDDVLLVRHGEPVKQGVFLGSLDLKLSKAGREMAARLEVGVNWPVYASPLQRAVETTEAAGLTYEVIEEFREIDYGPWEGLTWAEIEAKWPEEARLKMEDWLGYCVDGAESWEAFRGRVSRGLARCHQPCVIVAHLAVNSVLRELLTGEPAIGFRQGYCEIVKL
ncbi:MAG: histidine phosphatase family protein [Acidobacteria bacterium]|nr:histidine phosphatase family protein [Acidobacteriota bacterium]